MRARGLTVPDESKALELHVEKFAEGRYVMDDDHGWNYCPNCGARMIDEKGEDDG